MKRATALWVINPNNVGAKKRKTKTLVSWALDFRDKVNSKERGTPFAYFFTIAEAPDVKSRN